MKTTILLIVLILIVGQIAERIFFRLINYKRKDKIKRLNKDWFKLLLMILFILALLIIIVEIGCYLIF